MKQTVSPEVEGSKSHFTVDDKFANNEVVKILRRLRIGPFIKYTNLTLAASFVT